MSRLPKLSEQIQNVSDPRDFLRTKLPELVDLDTLLRCHICKGFIKTPVLTPCGHTFCSLCIREYLNRELKCPLCLAELRESMLRSEFLVNEVIASYVGLRSKLLEIARNAPDVTVPHSDTSLIEIAPGDGGAHETSGDDDDLQIIETRESRPAKRNAETIGAFSKKPRLGSEKPGITSMIGKSKSPALPEDSAECPICQKHFPLEFLQRTHLDECLTMGSLGAATNSTSPSNPVNASIEPAHSIQPATRHVSEPLVPADITHSNRYMESGQNQGVARLAKLNFSSMSLQQLKAKLTSLKLSTTGSRQQLINRYNHYEMLWNSNFMDSIEPVEERELRRKLASWEATHNSLEGTPKKGNISKLLKKNSITRIKDFKTDRFDRKGWILAHQQEFKELLEEARYNLAKGSKMKDATSNHDVSQDPDHADSHPSNASYEKGEIPSNQLVVKTEEISTSSQNTAGI
ncbi:LAQU0S09e03202g1_1 [Lachancea quebecensis]|uniref:Postreplication repair E3 ubiquitin-protein ligase RAD18 n=1 Tax=Lachancea quebecensis TaxID=1654605 RepID=A0A0P1KU67_9SACH|nr:LAQU0S09e03202g1_1 [Lachancea quebecensis]